jgi:hypothetical protein
MMFWTTHSSRFMRTLAFTLVLIIAREHPLQAAAPVNLTEIVAKLKTYFDSIESIEVEYSQTPVDDGKDHEVSQWRWIRSGPRKLLSLNSEPGGAGIKVPHMWFSFDGEHAYSVSVDLDAPQSIKRIYRTETIDQMYEELPNPLNFLGHPLQNSQAKLVELLPKSTVTGNERIGATECLRIELPLIETSGSEKAVTFWLDPQEGYLPRRYFQREPGAKEVGDAPPETSFFVLDFDEFMNVKDELLGEERRFPKSGRITGAGGTHRYDFNSVRINHQPQRPRFMHQAQIGSEMIVRRAGQPEVMTVYGGPAGVAKRQAEILELVEKQTEARRVADQEKAAGETPADARPPTSSWFWIVPATLCAGLLLVLFVSGTRMRG